MNLTRKNCIAERVHLNAGGYDSRGRYYGSGQPLYRLTPKTTTTWFHTRTNANFIRETIETRAIDARMARELASLIYAVGGE